MTNPTLDTFISKNTYSIVVSTIYKGVSGYVKPGEVTIWKYGNAIWKCRLSIYDMERQRKLISGIPQMCRKTEP